MPPFDLDSFMQTASVTQANATEFALPPAGEQPCECKGVFGRQLEDGRCLMDVSWSPRGWNGMPARQTIWLDFNEQGNLDFNDGKNVELGRTRSAVGQNTSAAWGPQMLVGTRATCRIVHDGQYARVKGVAPLHAAPAVPVAPAAGVVNAQFASAPVAATPVSTAVPPAAAPPVAAAVPATPVPVAVPVPPAAPSTSTSDSEW